MTVAFADLPTASAPAEELGRSRSDVALLVATRSDEALRRARFEELPRLLARGDLLVVNTSATLPAALPARLHGRPVRVHLSTRLEAEGSWVVEVRGADLGPRERPPLGTRLDLPEGGHLTLETPYGGSERLAECRLELPGEALAYLGRHGSPIRYDRGAPERPLGAYQTVFAREPGSAEMPSAGRPFSPRLVTEIVSAGVLVAPLVLHAGVSSLERDEAPFPERYAVPAETARLVDATHDWGGRVIAVGTTVARALETVATGDGGVRPGAGWTDVVITPERGLDVIDGLLTGWHEPESSHLLMLEAAAGRDLLARSYAEAAALGFVGHEFGDAHLILP